MHKHLPQESHPAKRNHYTEIYVKYYTQIQSKLQVNPTLFIIALDRIKKINLTLYIKADHRQPIANNPKHNIPKSET